MKPFSLYIHIPYCYQKCPYCDFNTYAVLQAPEEDYTSALLSELDWRATQEMWRERPIQTIFFGGGTPSIFSAKSIRKILHIVTQRFPVTGEVEVSLEANPGMVSTDNLSALRESGVNRISFGIQSFNNTTLKTLGRSHSPEQALSTVESAFIAGFKNISIDLMYGVPGQIFADVRSDIEVALQTEVPHISAYCLTIEKGTPFYQNMKRGLLKLPKDTVVLEMMDYVIDSLDKAGVKRYEISNFAKEGKEARHNLAYWNGDDYLGLGAGAHSFAASDTPSDGGGYGRRWANYAAPERYIDSAKTIGVAESWSESLDRKSALFEFFFLGLRKVKGVSVDQFEDIFDEEINARYGELIEILEAERLLKREGARISLTRKGFQLSDSVLENFAAC